MTACVYVYIKSLLGTVLSPIWPATVQVVSWLHTEESCLSHSIEALFSTPIQLEHIIFTYVITIDILLQYQAFMCLNSFCD